MESNTDLSKELAAYKASFLQRAAPESVAIMEAATANLRATGIESRALQVGAAAPELTLPDALGRAVTLSDLWRRGPLILTFYRGGWCPYCNLALRAWQRHLPDLDRLGAGLVAISPQTPDNSLSTAEKSELAFPVLSDSQLQASTAFGVAFEMSPELIELYRRAGHDLPVRNGNGRWVLPVPATYVIDSDGRIPYAHVEADHRVRAEPRDVLAAVTRLGKDRTHLGGGSK